MTLKACCCPVSAPGVLILSEDRDTVEVLEGLIEVLGFTPLWTRSAEEALETLSHFEVFLVLIDTESEAAERLGQEGRAREIPMVFVTDGSPEAGADLQRFSTAAADYLLKPIHPVLASKKIDLFFDLHCRGERLAGKDSELRRMIYIASHNLRTPLVNIEGFSQELVACCNQIKEILEGREVPKTVVDEVSPILDLDIPEAVDFIGSNVLKMGHLLKGMQKIWSLGQTVPEPSALDMNVVVQQVLDRMKFEIKANRIEMDVSELPACHADGELVTQVFSNLIGNALQHANPGGGGTVEISGEPGRTYCIYSVRDDGVGIPVDHQSRVFDLFHRIHSETEGLGLPSVKVIVERHGGRVWVESAPGEGAAFFVALPARELSGLETRHQA